MEILKETPEVVEAEITQPTVAQFGNCQRVFDYFNAELFGGELKQCILNFSRLKRSHGFFTWNRWKRGENPEDENMLHEISLNPDTNNRTPKEVFGTLVHEMCHLWQQDFGTPRRKGYHDKEFAAKMEEVGLICSTTGEPGGKKTGQNMTHYIEEGGLFEEAFNAMPKEFLLPFQAKPMGEGGSGSSKNANKIKYTCGGCASNVWGKPSLRIICEDCEQHYEAV